MMRGLFYFSTPGVFLLSVLMLPPVIANENTPDLQEPGESATAISDYLLLNNARLIHGIRLNREQVNNLYAGRDYESIWVDNRGIKAIGYLFIRELGDSWKHGLEPEDYHYSTFQTLVSSLNAFLLETEILLTDAFIRYHSDIHKGRLALKKVANEWYIQENFNSDQLLKASIPDNELVIPFPDHQGYKKLQEKLVWYIGIKQKGGFQRLGKGPVLSKGIRHNQVINLRNLLSLIGDYKAQMQADPYYYSAAIARAVVRFQNRHHLVADGVVGKATRQALNVPLDHRIDQIKLSLERWRWLPKSLGDKYIWINLAAANLDVFESGKKKFTMRSIIGRPYRSTPSLSGELSTVVLNPEWVVPRRLAVEDMLPLQQASGDYLQKKNIRVLAGWSGVQSEVNPEDIDWASLNVNYFPYQLRQSPGDSNSLGRFKFLFRNPFDIYLHDTPAKRLFHLEKRTFSSGCIRLEEPQKLANYLMEQDPLYNLRTMRDKLDAGETSYVRLTNKIPVYIVYMTAWVEDDEIHFQRDFYGRDRPILQAMHNKSLSQGL